MVSMVCPFYLLLSSVDMRARVSMMVCMPYLSARDSSPISRSSISSCSSTSSSLSSRVRASTRHHLTHRGSSSPSHMSHLSGSPESGSLNSSLEGQEARQKEHSSYSLPSMVYLSLPAHSAMVYSPAYT